MGAADFIFRKFSIVFVLSSIALTVIEAQQPTPCCRTIVSLAPNITELLYALNLGDRIAGVTPYCLYPPEAASKPKIGGFLDPNYEAIVSLSPDLIFGLSSHLEHRQRLEKLGLRFSVLSMNTIPEILRAIMEAGDQCHAENAAIALRNQIETRIAHLRSLTRNRTPARVMICIGRDYQSEGLDQVYIAGTDSFHEGIIELAGGVNAYTRPRIEYPAVSAEGVLSMNPDVIVELRPGEKVSSEAIGRMQDVWKTLPSLSAVKSRRLFILTDDFASIPGPRFIDIAEKLAGLLYPDAMKPRETHVPLP